MDPAKVAINVQVLTKSKTSLSFKSELLNFQYVFLLLLQSSPSDHSSVSMEWSVLYPGVMSVSLTVLHKFSEIRKKKKKKSSLLC